MLSLPYWQGNTDKERDAKRLASCRIVFFYVSFIFFMVLFLFHFASESPSVPQSSERYQCRCSPRRLHSRHWRHWRHRRLGRLECFGWAWCSSRLCNAEGASTTCPGMARSSEQAEFQHIFSIYL